MLPCFHQFLTWRKPFPNSPALAASLNPSASVKIPKSEDLFDPTIFTQSPTCHHPHHSPRYTKWKAPPKQSRDPQMSQLRKSTPQAIQREIWWVWHRDPVDVTASHVGKSTISCDIWGWFARGHERIAQQTVNFRKDLLDRLMQFVFAAHDFTMCFTSDYTPSCAKTTWHRWLWFLEWCGTMWHICHTNRDRTSTSTFLQAARAKSGPLSMLISAHVASRRFPWPMAEGEPISEATEKNLEVSRLHRERSKIYNYIYNPPSHWPNRVGQLIL